MGWPHSACRGFGCDRCEATGFCPGCGEPWEPRLSPLSAADCAAMGVTRSMCRHCGKHWRRKAGAVRLNLVGRKAARHA